MTTPTRGPAPTLCTGCDVALGYWPADDPRCPSCRRSERRPGDPAPRGGAR